MLIRHISILNLDKAGISKNNKNSGCYSMRVYLSGNPDQTWKRHFISEWWKVFFYKKKTLEFSLGELRLHLERNEDLQKYVETVKRLVDRTNKTVVMEQKKRKNEFKRKLRICSSVRSKVYKIV